MPTRPPIHRPAGHRRAKQEQRAQYNRTPQRREHQALYDWDWRRYSKRRLALHPWCVECVKEGKPGLATVTDHIVPHRGDRVLFLDPNNHQSLCKRHHDRKTATEDGGFTGKK